MEESPRPPLAVHLVAHTHWDREWYRSAGEFRAMLVELVDEVLDRGDRLPFLLDGQGIVVEDYLQWRPERTDAVRQALRSGHVEAGPWYVLADNLLPSGEALVRNLLAGRDAITRLGGAVPPVLYCPDAFGHPAALPRLAAGFGLPVCIVWRGYGGLPWPPGDTARWRAADASEVLLYHLAPEGYELGASLPVDPGSARTRWQRLAAVLAPRATIGVALLPNGADHHAVQRHRAEAIAALQDAAAGDAAIRISTLRDFAAALGEAAAQAGLPVVHGELRRSPDYAWSLQGTPGTRAWQKRANAIAERLLLHDVEPLAALAWWSDGRSRRHEGRALWRTLLRCHPHDTLCGCSIDAVAQAFDARIAAVRRTGATLAARSRLAWLGADPAADRERVAQWRRVLAVWNPLPRPRAGIAELAIDESLGVVPVGPGSGVRGTPPARRRPLRVGDASIITQELSREWLHVRQESPRHYPRDELVLRRRVLALVPSVDALGLRTFPLSPGRPPRLLPEHAVVASADALDNGRCRVSIAGGRALDLMTADGLEIRDVLALEVIGDRGDLYTHSPIPGTRVVGRILGHRLLQRGPLRGILRLTLGAVVPARVVTTATGRVRRGRRARVEVVVDVQLDAGAASVVLHARGTRCADDCRVRLVLRLGVENASVVADAAFGPVERPNADAVPALRRGSANETEVRTAPLHRYLTLQTASRAVSVLSDGLAEYEVSGDGTVAITLARAVGDLSRNDLPERPGHAGWPVATPGAQSPGDYEGRVAILPHVLGAVPARHEVAAAAEDFLLPLVGDTWGSAIAPPHAHTGPQLTGDGLVYSSCKESEDGESLVLRCLNLTDQVVAGRWQLAGVREAWLARLDETPLGALTVRDDGVDFDATPHAIVTVLLKR